MNADPSLKTRRDFLRTSLVGGAMTWTVPVFLARTFDALGADQAGRSGRAPADLPVLVVVQLAGGNDGLNTVVPFGNDHYRRARPRLGLRGQDVLKLDENLGLHPGLQGFQALFDAGQLAVVQGVGYPNPNRSHFRSTEIWQTASDADRAEKYGWIGRYFDHACAGADPVVGVHLGRQTPQAFAARRPLGVSLENPESFRFAGLDDADGLSPEEAAMAALNRPAEEGATAASENAGGTIGAVAGRLPVGGSVLDYVERTALDAQVSADALRGVSRRGRNEASYPATQLANHLKLVARLIGGGLPTRIYYVSQGGYDTHTRQAATHPRLLRELGDSVQAFLKDLQAQGNLERVLVMTFSEFGRRVAENANEGTDHGAAAPLFVAGSRVKAGLLGRYPSLAPADLVNGDPRYAVDFRSLYAGVLEGWLRVPSERILGRQFVPLALV